MGGCCQKFEGLLRRAWRVYGSRGFGIRGDSQFGLHGFANFQSILPTAIRVFLFGGNQGYYPRPMCHVGVELGVWGLSFHGIPIGAMQLVCFGVVVQGCTVQTLGLWG